MLDLVDGAGHPRPVRQQPVFAAGKLRRLDFYWPQAGLVVEADSRKHHLFDSQAFEEDPRRKNAIALKGLHPPHLDLRRPPERAGAAPAGARDGALAARGLKPLRWRPP